MGMCLLRDFLHPGCMRHVCLFLCFAAAGKGVTISPLKFSGNALLEANYSCFLANFLFTVEMTKQNLLAFNRS